MKRTKTVYIDPNLPGLAGQNVVRGVADAMPLDGHSAKRLRRLNDHLLRDIGFERRHMS